MGATQRTGSSFSLSCLYLNFTKKAEKLKKNKKTKNKQKTKNHNYGLSVFALGPGHARSWGAGRIFSPGAAPVLPQPSQSPRKSARGAPQPPRQTPGEAVGEKTLTRPDNNRRGGEGGSREPLSARRTAWSSRNAAAAPDAAAAAAPVAAGGRPPFSCVWIRLTTSLSATRPGSAGSCGRRRRRRRRNRLQRLETQAAGGCRACARPASASRWGGRRVLTSRPRAGARRPRDVVPVAKGGVGDCEGSRAEGPRRWRWPALAFVLAGQSPPAFVSLGQSRAEDSRPRQPCKIPGSWTQVGIR